MSIKTNAIRIVETAKIDYVLHSYPCKEALDAVTVAGKIGAEIERVFKTLVTVGKSGNYYVFVVPGAEPLYAEVQAKKYMFSAFPSPRSLT